MLGFTPGFAYLGGMDELRHAPPGATPRTVIPAGSVGIAGKTGIYPIDSPGGWQLIGWFPSVFDPWWNPPTLGRRPDWVRFEAVGEADFTLSKAAAKAGTYDLKTGVRRRPARRWPSA